MSLRIHNNLAAMAAQTNLFQATQRVERGHLKLATGLRIAGAADDAAGLGVVERMRVRARSMQVAARNMQDGISLVQVFEGALGEPQELIHQQRELAVQAGSGTLGEDELELLDDVKQTNAEEIGRLIRQTEYGGRSLLRDNGTVDIQMGLDDGETLAIDLENFSAWQSAFENAHLFNAAGRDWIMRLSDLFTGLIGTARAKTGTAQTVLEGAQRQILDQRTHVQNAESRLRDVDMAEETSNLTRNQIVQSAATAVLAQANLNPELALMLI
ncbi:MAG: flagellin [Planctomycetota bacterium]|nr:flagellin [Planctomycetota bacterium]